MLDISAIDQRLARLVQEKHLAGVSVCVKGPEGTVFERCYGVRDTAMQIPVDPDTMFGIASMSKSITALACALLHVEGKLCLSDPVTKYFPEFRVPGTPRDAVTLLHLCRHSAGIPPMEPLEWSIAMNSHRKETDWLRAMRETSPNQMDSIGQIIDYIAHCPYPTLGAPGEIMSYCNEGYAILSYVVDQAAGMPLERYVMERIFRPLSMTRTVMDDDCASARALSGGNLTALFERVNGVTIADENWSIMPPFRGCATVKSTAPDMAAYYKALSDYGMKDGAQVLPREAVELLIGEGYPVTDQDVYCLGLKKYKKFGHVVCEHAGGLHGVSTWGALLPGEGYGFAVLCNQGDEEMEPLIWTLYSAVCGLPLDSCWRRFVPCGRGFSDPQMLTGTFVGHEGMASVLTITLEDGRPMGHIGHTAFPLFYCDATRFLAFPDGEDNPCMLLEFLIRNGVSWGVRVGTRVYGRKD